MGKIITFGKEVVADTDQVESPVDHTLKDVVWQQTLPVLLNSRTIIHPATPIAPRGIIEKKILEKLETALPMNSLGDGEIKLDLRSVVVDDAGKIAYAAPVHVLYSGSDHLKRDIGEYQDQLLPQVTGLPKATLNGKTVPYLQRIYLKDYNIWIKSHHVHYKKVPKGGKRSLM